jgi:hypothetical protein
MNDKTVERKEWEMGEGETAKAYDAFREYRDLGASRSLVKVAEKLGKSVRHLKKWSTNHDWPSRALAYDEHIEKKRQGVYETKLGEVNAAHLDMVRSARESVMVPLRALLRRIEKVREDGTGAAAEVENIPIEKLLSIARPYVKLALEVIRMERLLYGLPTQTIKTEGTIGHNVSHDIKIVNEYIESLPDEELLRIVRNTKKRARNDGNGRKVSRGKGEG